MVNRVIGPLLFLIFAWFVVSNDDARTIIDRKSTRLNSSH